MGTSPTVIAPVALSPTCIMDLALTLYALIERVVAVRSTSCSEAASSLPPAIVADGPPTESGPLSDAAEQRDG